MVNTRGFARLGMLAVGLGIGAAWAHTPVAAADSSSDWLSSIDGLLSGALPAADPSGLNLAISFDGMSLVQDGNATATTASGEYGLAIAYGDGAAPTAEGGTGNYALADGTNAEAAAAGPPARPATTSTAPSTSATTGRRHRRLQRRLRRRGQPSGDQGGTGSGSYNTAIDIGNNASGTFDDGAHAGSGGLAGLGDDGNRLRCSASCELCGNGQPSYAASGGGFDPAVVGNDNIATVFDPFGTLGSTAVAGEGFDIPGNFDLAAVFGDGFDTFPAATGGNFLVEILPTLF